MEERNTSEFEQTGTNMSVEEEGKENKPCRDEKGHFISNPNAPSSGMKRIRKTRKQKEEEEARIEDENTVKIRIVKDEEPLPGKEFEGKLEDMKERTASNFIKSVARRKPQRISIDGNFYYAASVLDEIKKKYLIEKGHGKKCLDTLKDSIDVLNTTEGVLKDYLEENHKVRKSRFVWRGIACFMIGLIVAYSAAKAIISYRNNTSIEHQIELPTTK